MKRFSFIRALFLAFGPLILQCKAASVDPLDALNRPEGWKSASSPTQIAAVDGGVEVAPDSATSTIDLDCAVAQPLDGSTGRVGFWLYAKTGEKVSPLNVTFRFRDAQGRLYEYNTTEDVWSSLTIPSETWTYVESYPLEARQGDFLPGTVGHLVGAASTEMTPLPAMPLSLTGIQVSSKSKGIERLQIRGMVFSRLDLRTSDCYWQANGRSLTTEDTGIREPFVLASDYANQPGDYRVYWEISEARSGQTLVAGNQTFTRKDEIIPHFDPVKLSLLPPGSYHLRTRVWKVGETAGTTPGTYAESSDWLLVFRGKEPPPASAALPSELDRIAIDSETPSGVHAPAAHVDIPVAVETGGLTPENGPYSLEWKINHYDQRALQQGTIAVDATTGGVFKAVIPFDVPSDDNVFQIEAMLKQGGQVIDSREKIFGFRGTAPAAPVYGEIPASPDPALFVGIEAMGKKFRDDARYLRHLQALHAMGFTGIEYAVEWAEVEPLPGCFTFAEMDRQLETARRLGFKIMLRFRSEFPRYTIPDWVTGDFICEQDGKVDGLLSGGPVFSPCDARWVADYEAFQQAVASRHAEDKTVIAYKVCQNIRESYWLDRPFKYQFSDYCDSAASAYRNYLKTRYSNLGDVAHAHGATYATWESIDPPQPYASSALLDLTPSWRDWCAFKTATYNQHLIEVATKLHAAAPQQHLYFYSINQLTGPPSRETLLQLEGLNTSLATGGSTPLGEISYNRLYPTGYGLRLITEPNAYAMPSAFSADDHAGSVLEGSAGKGPVLFSNWPTNLDPDGAGDPRQGALARLVQWNRVFQAVPRLRMPPAPIGLVFSWDSMSSGQRGMYSPSFTEVLNKDYLAPFKRHGLEAFGADDTFTPDMLSHFKMLVLPPETSPAISAKLLASVTAYVRNGGALVLASTSGNICPDAPDKPRALMTALGIPAGDSSGADPTPYPVGQGMAWVCRDVKDLQRFLDSESFLEALSQRGVKPSFRALDEKVVATLHDGQDGHFYLYVYNGGSSDEVTLSVAESPLGGSVFEVQDLINGGEAKAITLSGDTSFSLPLKKRTGGLLKISLPP